LDALPDEPPDPPWSATCSAWRSAKRAWPRWSAAARGRRRLGITEGNRPRHAQVRVRQGWACRTRANWRRCWQKLVLRW